MNPIGSVLGHGGLWGGVLEGSGVGAVGFVGVSRGVSWCISWKLFCPLVFVSLSLSLSILPGALVASSGGLFPGLCLGGGFGFG